MSELNIRRIEGLQNNINADLQQLRKEKEALNTYPVGKDGMNCTNGCGGEFRHFGYVEGYGPGTPTCTANWMMRAGSTESNRGNCRICLHR